MVTREHLVSDFTVEHAKKYLKLNIEKAKGYSRSLNLHPKTIAPKALAELGKRDKDGNYLVHWDNLSITSGSMAINDSNFDELFDVSFNTLCINDGKVGVESIAKLLEANADGGRFSQVNIGALGGDRLKNDFMEDLVEKAASNADFARNHLYTILDAIENKRLEINSIGLKLDEPRCSRIALELFGEGSDALDRFAKSFKFYNIPALPDNRESVLVVAIIFGVLLRSQTMRLRASSIVDSVEIDLENVVAVFDLLNKTSEVVLADGLVMALATNTMARVQDKDIKKICKIINLRMPGGSYFKWLDDNYGKFECVFEEHLQLAGLGFDDYLRAVNKLAQEETAKIDRMTARIRQLLPSGNILNDIYNWKSPSGGTIGFMDGNLPFFDGRPDSGKLPSHLPESFKGYTEEFSIRMAMLRTIASSKPCAGVLSNDILKQTVDFGVLIRLEQNITSSNLGYEGRQLGEVMGLYDGFSAGFGPDLFYYCNAPKVVADGEVFKLANGVENAAFPVAINLGRLAEDIAAQSEKAYTSLPQLFKEQELHKLKPEEARRAGMPENTCLYGVDITGLSGHSKAVKAMLTEHILGIGRSPIKRLYDIEAVCTNSGRPIRFKSGFEHTGITCRSIISFIQCYEQYRVMELHLAQGLKIEHEDFMPILEVLDDVVARAAYLCKDGLAHENKLDRDLRLAKLFPNMLPFSDSVLSYATNSRPGSMLISKDSIDDAKYYYTYVLPRFRIDLIVPSTCMMSNKLLVEIMQRVKACNKHNKLVADIGLESLDPALCSMSDMFTYNISDIDKGDMVVIHDELSQKTRHQLSEHNVVIGHNPDGRIVTRNLEYYESYSSSMTSCPVSTGSILEAVRRKRSGCELDKNDIELLAANDSSTSKHIKDQITRGSDFKKISIACRGSDYMKTLFSKVSEYLKGPEKTPAAAVK